MTVQERAPRKYPGVRPQDVTARVARYAPTVDSERDHDRLALARLAIASIAVFAMFSLTFMSVFGMSTTRDLEAMTVPDALTFGIGGLALGLTYARRGMAVAILLGLAALALVTPLAIDVVVSPSASVWSTAGLATTARVAAFTIIPAAVFSWVGWRAPIDGGNGR